MQPCSSVSYGNPNAGNPHVRFDEGEVASARPRRGSLLCSSKLREWKGAVAAALTMGLAFGATTLAWGEAVEVSTWADVKSNLEANRSVKLMADIAQGTLIGATMTANQSVALDLNGHKITGSTLTTDGGRMFVVGPGSLTIDDTAGGGVIDGLGVVRDTTAAFAWLRFVVNTHFTINGGTIQNFVATDDAGAIYVNVYADFTMNGGTIKNCKAGGDGGAVCVLNGGTFTMNDGTIESNSTAEGWGDSVFVDYKGTLNQLGGTIQDSAKTVYKACYVTVNIPEVAGATGAIYYQGKAVKTTEVPSNAVVRVVYTAEEGKAWGNGVFVWQKDSDPAAKSVQDAPSPAAPTVWSGSEASTSITFDTRSSKTYFSTNDIPPVWYDEKSTVKAKGAAQLGTVTLVDNATKPNSTVTWMPKAKDTYTLRYESASTGVREKTVSLVDPVEITKEGIDVENTQVTVMVDGVPIVPQTEAPFAGKLIVASNSTVSVVYTVNSEADDLYFADGSTTYTQTFTAAQPVNAVGEKIVKPAVPAAPSLKLGTAAQRYPWNGMVDVFYKALNTPNVNYEVELTITPPDGTPVTKTFPARNGINSVSFEAKDVIGEGKRISGVKIRAKLLRTVSEP